MRPYATENGPSLSHHGIRGQKWGVRRYQNEDGSLTAEGKLRQNQHQYLVNKATQRAEKNSSRIEEESWNEVADELNSSDYFKKHNWGDPKTQEDVAGRITTRYNRKLLSEIEQDKYYKKAERLAKKYNMSEWSAEYRDYERGRKNVIEKGYWPEHAH